jgi:hypothetical protein
MLLIKVFFLTDNKKLFRFKRLLFWILAIGFISCDFVKQDKTCEKFKQGKFIYNSRNSQGQVDRQFLINRHDSIQTEVDNHSGKTSKILIKWTGNCSYELILIETTFNYPDSIQKIRKTVPLKIEILSSTNDYYIFQAKMDNSNFVMTDTLWFDK